MAGEVLDLRGACGCPLFWLTHAESHCAYVCAPLLGRQKEATPICIQEIVQKGHRCVCIITVCADLHLC